VSATGGFFQGGGHGPLTRWKGMAADQVLEFDVVTADGRRS
jgi:FAD/FMN-containing dehydrogenase